MRAITTPIEPTTNSTMEAAGAQKDPLRPRVPVPDQHAPRRELAAGGYTCPLTGEQLPCPRCCPLNK